VLLVKDPLGPKAEVTLRRLRHCVESLQAAGGLLVLPEDSVSPALPLLHSLVSDRPLAITDLAGLASSLASLHPNLA
jgi:hypothetical protein